MDKIREEFEKPIYNVIDMRKAIQAGVKSRDEEIVELHESCNNYKKMYVDKMKEIKKLRDALTNILEHHSETHEDGWIMQDYAREALKESE